MIFLIPGSSNPGNWMLLLSLHLLSVRATVESAWALPSHLPSGITPHLETSQNFQHQISLCRLHSRPLLIESWWIHPGLAHLTSPIEHFANRVWAWRYIGCIFYVDRYFDKGDIPISNMYVMLGYSNTWRILIEYSYDIAENIQRIQYLKHNEDI